MMIGMDVERERKSGYSVLSARLDDDNNDIYLCIVIYKAICFDVAQGRMNGAPNETRTHSCRFGSQAC